MTLPESLSGAAMGRLAARLVGSALSVAPALLVGLLPKCPMCIGAYLGAFGFVGVQALPVAYVWPLTWIFLAIAMGFMLNRARRRKRFGPFGAAMAGGLLLLYARWTEGDGFLVIAGMIVFMAASVWSWYLPASRSSCARAGRARAD